MMSLSASITLGNPRADAETTASIDDAIADDRANADIAVVDLDPDTLNEHYNRDDKPEPVTLRRNGSSLPQSCC